MSKKTKLELTWIGKDEEVRVEPRILMEDADKSYSASMRFSESDCFENKIIYGDNLLALKALEAEYSGKIKCIYIDPPYNTGNAFTHYDDGVEHSIWLSLMKPRLEILKRLLTYDGTIWISVDDDEMHYLKVLCDEVFGRRNFVASIVWQKIHSIKNDAKYISSNHEYILIYATNIENISFNLLERTEEMNMRYSNPDNDIRGPWQSGDLVANEERVNGSFDVVGPTGKVFNVPSGKHWVYSKENLLKMIQENRIWFGKNGDAFPRKKRFLSEVQQGRKPDTWWSSDQVGHNQEAKREVKNLMPSDIFPTPKPERLIQRILEISTDPGDIVLDSFAGSGTTGAVAHKMGRQWIMIELGNHCHTHIIPRLQQVIDGTDLGGISKKVNWQGGGGFRYYSLAPSLLEKDEFGQWIINKNYNAPMLAEAMCKHHGFTYEPDESVYWKQGWSTENDYMYTTTQLMTRELATLIHDSLGENETVLICCKAYNLNETDFPKITFQKIPASILNRCEFGRDDYSLNVAQLPQLEKTEQLELFSEGEEL